MSLFDGVADSPMWSEFACEVSHMGIVQISSGELRRRVKTVTSPNFWAGTGPLCLISVESASH
jgi:hypothetical protein